MKKWAKRSKGYLLRNRLTLLSLAGAASIGAVTFLLLFGFDVLNVTNVAWLRQGNDLNQHFLGWQFFRNSEWGFPFGMVQGIAYPVDVSITYLDSIPLAALFFKILSPILPVTFQYIGLWAFGSYVLQGLLAGLIARRFTKNVFLILLVAAFFVMSPILFSRTFVHTALASHWIILGSIALTVYYSRLQITKSATTLWSLLFICAALVHPYFLPMVGAVFVVYNILVFRKSRIVKQLLLAILPPLLSIFALWSIGAFSLRPTVGDNGLNIFNMNLLAPFNPMGWSFYLSSLPSHNAFSESFNFLGLGLLTLILMLLPLVTLRYNHKYFKVLRQNTTKFLIIVAIAIGYLYFSIGPNIYLGTLTLLSVPTPEVVDKIWGIFRANARMFWLLYYVIYTGVLIAMIVVFREKPKLLIPIFLAIFIAGTSDFYYSNATKERTASVKQRALQYESVQNKNRNDNYTQFSHIVMLDNDLTSSQKLNIGNVADINKLTVSDSYFARSPADKIEFFRNQSVKSAVDGSIAKDTMYILKNDSPLVPKIQLGNFNVASISLNGTSYIILSHR